MLTVDDTEFPKRYSAHPKQFTGRQTHIQTNFPAEILFLFLETKLSEGGRMFRDTRD